MIICVSYPAHYPYPKKIKLSTFCLAYWAIATTQNMNDAAAQTKEERLEKKILPRNGTFIDKILSFICIAPPTNDGFT